MKIKILNLENWSVFIKHIILQGNIIRRADIILITTSLCLSILGDEFWR